MKLETEKLLSLERIRQGTELARLEVQRHKLQLVAEGKIADASMFGDTSVETSGRSANDVLGELELAPKFNERDPDVFFMMFERLAEARGWSDSTCTLLLQCVLTGKAQEACSSLSNGESVKYVSVKAAVLKAYELVPEAHHQRFRSWKKGDKSHLEFACDLSAQFERWCSAAGVSSHETLRDLIVLEQFKNSVPEHIATFISERKVKTAAGAASLADDFVLAHGGGGSVARSGSRHRDSSSAGGA